MPRADDPRAAGWRGRGRGRYRHDRDGPRANRLTPIHARVMCGAMNEALKSASFLLLGGTLATAFLFNTPANAGFFATGGDRTVIKGTSTQRCDVQNSGCDRSGAGCTVTDDSCTETLTAAIPNN